MSSYDNRSSGTFGWGMGYSGGAGQENRSYDSTGYSSYGDRDRNTTFGFSGDRSSGYGSYSGSQPTGSNYYRTETTTYNRDSDNDRNRGGYGSSDRYGSSGSYSSSDRNNSSIYGYGSNSGYGSNTGYGSSDRYGSSGNYSSSDQNRYTGYTGSNTGYGSSGYGSSGNYNTGSYGTGYGSGYGQDRDRRDYSSSSTMRYGSGNEYVRDSDRTGYGSSSNWSSQSHPSNYGSYHSSSNYNTGSNSGRNDYGYQSSALSRYDDRTNRDRSTSAYGGNYGSSYTTDRSYDRSIDRSNDNDQGFFSQIGNYLSNLIGLTDKSSTGGSSRTIRPQIVEESGVKKVQYNFDVRGFSPENVNLTASGQRIEVTATQEDKDDDHHVRREYRRVITVPEGIKVESFKSRVLQNGVLRVEAPIQVDQLTADQQRSLLGEIPITKGALTSGSSSTTTGSSGTSGSYSSGTTGGKTTTTEHVRETTKTSS